MLSSIKAFIEENKDLIEDNEWKKLQKKAQEYLSNKSIGQFNELMIEAGVDPIQGLDYIPRLFLYFTKIVRVDIPSYIKKVGDYAFASCYNLTEVNIPESVIEIGEGAFRWNPSLRHLVFKGTKEEWNKIEKKKHWVSDSPLEVIHCEDGPIFLYPSIR